MTEKIQYSPKMQQLVELAAELEDLNHIGAVLGWDQQTYMPPGGAEERGLQLSSLGRIMHEKFTSDEVGQLISELVDEVGDLNAGNRRSPDGESIQTRLRQANQSSPSVADGNHSNHDDGE